MEYWNAFWVGGLICVLVQILIENTKLMPGRIMVILVVIGSLMGAVGIFEPLKSYAGAGVTVPLIGFGNSLWEGVREAVEQEGFLGLFQGGLKAAAVGTSAALIFSYLASLICQPRMKK